jgi:hypothetical protein
MKLPRTWLASSQCMRQVRSVSARPPIHVLRDRPPSCSTAPDALCLLVGCMLTVLDEVPSDEERQLSLDRCIDLLKGVPVGLKG